MDSNWWPRYIYEKENVWQNGLSSPAITRSFSDGFFLLLVPDGNVISFGWFMSSYGRKRRVPLWQDRKNYAYLISFFLRRNARRRNVNKNANVLYNQVSYVRDNLPSFFCLLFESHNTKSFDSTGVRFGSFPRWPTNLGLRSFFYYYKKGKTLMDDVTPRRLLIDQVAFDPRTTLSRRMSQDLAFGRWRQPCFLRTLEKYVAITTEWF